MTTQIDVTSRGLDNAAETEMCSYDLECEKPCDRIATLAVFTTPKGMRLATCSDAVHVEGAISAIRYVS